MVAYFGNVWRLRHFWMALVRNDLRSRYRRSLFGMGWSLLQPIAMTAVLCTVFSQLLGVSLREYAPFLLIGLTFWSFIAAVANQGCNTFIQGECYIRQHRVPLAVYPLRTVLSASYHFLIGLAIVITFVGFVKGYTNWAALATLAPTLGLLFVFGWSLAVCTGTLNALFHDTQHLLEILLQILFYLTPIMYPLSMLRERHLAWFVQLNPIASLIEMVRQPLLQGQFPDAYAVGMSISATLVTMLTAMFLLKWCERRLVFYL